VTAHRLREAACPICKTKLDAATGLRNDAAPKVGDLSMCARCGQPLRFGVDLMPYAVNLDTVRGATSATDFRAYCRVRDAVLARKHATN